MIVAAIVIGGCHVLLLVLRAGLAISYSRSLPIEGNRMIAPGCLTIVQPILSGDPLLESRLEQNLTALHDQCFLWLIDEEDDEAQRVADLLLAARSDIEIAVKICPPCPEATNPKLWKLRIASGMVRTPYFGVLDDDATMSPSTVAALIDGADRYTVATGLPCYLDSGDLPSGLLSQFVNNNSVFTYLGTSRLLAPFTLNGMGYVMRRAALEDLQNFEPVMNELTDDLALATLVLGGGGTIHQSAAPLRVQTGVRNFRHYVEVMHRWYVFTLLLMRRQTLPVQALIFLLHGLPPLLLGALVVLTIASWNLSAVGLLAAILVVREIVIGSMLRRFFGRGMHRPWVSILSELIQPLHLVHALSCRTIRWRTRRYRVHDSNDFSSV